MKEETTITYDLAFKELQNITQQIENSEISVDELSTLVAKATQLLEICKAKLGKTEAEVKQIIETIKE